MKDHHRGNVFIQNISYYMLFHYMLCAKLQAPGYNYYTKASSANKKWYQDYVHVLEKESVFTDI